MSKAGTGAGTWLSHHRARILETLAVLFATTLAAILITWPLASDIGGLIPGNAGGDQLGYLFDFWYFANYSLPLFSDHVQTVVGAPFGRVVPAVPNLTLATTLVPATLITSLFGPVVAYNVLTIAGLALTGASMYLLVRWMGLGIGPASWAGLAYMVLPYHLLAAQSWVTLVPYQCFPLLLIGLIAWVRGPTLRNGIGTGLALAFCIVTFPYFGVMAMFMLAVAMVASYLIHARKGGWLGALRAPAWLVGGLAVFLFLPLAIIAALNRSGTALQQRNPQEVSDLGPYLSDYWTPPKTSAFMNGFTDANTWYGLGSVGGERLMYVGAAAVVLTVVGAVLAIIWRGRLTPTWRALMIAGPPMIAVLVIASLRTPYPVGGSEITMPSRIIFDNLPYIRAFGRFIIAISAIAIAIGAVGLRLIMNRFPGNGARVAVASAVLLTAFEAGVGLPIATTSATALPQGRQADDLPTWNWLAQRKDDGIVFEQPEIGNTAWGRIWMYGATQHGHRVLNVIGNPGDQSGDLIAQVNGPPSTTAARVMATAGIRYMTINPWAYEDMKIGPAPTTPPAGFEVAATFPEGSSVWRVTARPAGGFVTFQQGFDRVRFEQRGSDWLNWRWMFDTGSVRAWVKKPGSYRAAFRAAPAGSAQTLVVVSSGGFTSRVRITEDRPVTAIVRVAANGSLISLRAEPGAAASGQPTLQMTQWLLEPIR